MAETLNTRVARLEESQSRAWAAIERVAEQQEKLDEALATLTDAQIKMVEIQNQDKIESREREKRVDERISALVSAIGELVRRNGGTER